jgi:hypothetical protein
MASLAETLGAKGIQQNAVTSDIQSGLKTGMQLATMEDQISQEKMKTDEMKMKLDTAKFNKAVGSLQTLARANPQIAKKLVPRIQQSMQEAGIAVDPLILDSIASDDEWKRRINSSSAIFSGMAKSEAAMQEGLSALNDFGMLETGLQELSNQNKLETQEKMATARLERQVRGTERQISKDQSKALVDSKNKFDSAIKEDLEILSQGKKAESLLSTNGTISSEAAKTTVARMFEKGVLTDQDVARLSGGKSMYDRGNQLAESLISGKITPANRKELQSIVREIRKVVSDKIKTRAERDVEAQASIWPDIPRERFSQALGVDALLGSQTEKSPKDIFMEKAIAAGATPEQAAAEAAKRYGAN